jgi:hypothetical protein
MRLFVYREADGRRKLLLLGTGNSDRLDVLAASGFEEVVAAAALERVAAEAGRWDVCELLGLPESSPLLRIGAVRDRRGRAADVGPVRRYVRAGGAELGHPRAAAGV